MGKKVAIIGAGAAGYFAAFSCKKHHPEFDVTIYEKTKKVLQKVKISGGGRCNVTHDARNISDLVKSYPRGGRQLKKCFGTFSVDDTINWFEKRGITLKTEDDGRMFPVSDSSETIIKCFKEEAQKLKIKLLTSQNIVSVDKNSKEFVLNTKEGDQHTDYVIIAAGGSPKASGMRWLNDLGHKTVPPVPSLFTFNFSHNNIKHLMGLSVPNGTVKIIGTKLQYQGPILITHWGVSGPAVLKLSAWGARHLNDLDYDFKVQINWTDNLNEESLRSVIQDIKGSSKKIINANFLSVPNRLWEYLLEKNNIDQNTKCAELDKKSWNKLINSLVNDQFDVKGKTTFKEEFVTAGGVDLSQVDFSTMQSRVLEGVYFAGEVLDIDGITGGFNFQAAWSTGYVAGMLKA